MTVLHVFAACVNAIRRGELIVRESSKDKEFHFQNWFMKRLRETKLNFELGGRNSYPDFRLVKFQDGYEIKGLAYPGRDANFDSNSQVPTGFHNGRQIYYVFGRYPAQPDGRRYPVLDLVICHGDFLNADHDYVHENKNIKGFGSYGDVMIRDRKMYVVPTPFRLIDGVAHAHTLVVPIDAKVGSDFVQVGELTRVEADELIVGYTFDLKSNVITPKKVRNPSAGKTHTFSAWGLKGATVGRVFMRALESRTEIDADGPQEEE